MCGILGSAVGAKSPLTALQWKSSLEQIFLLSESRGKESAGLHISLPESGSAWTLKGNVPASKLIRTREYHEILRQVEQRVYGPEKKFTQEPMMVIAHSRLVTNGAAELVQNNQPVGAGSVSMVHNGIIVNVSELWAKHKHLKRSAEVDTEIMAALLREECAKGSTPVAATRRIYQEICGAASIAWVDDATPALTLATNTGDLYYLHVAPMRLLLFASEKFILRAITTLPATRGVSTPGLPARQGLTFDAGKGEIHHFHLDSAEPLDPSLSGRFRGQLTHHVSTVQSRQNIASGRCLQKPDLGLLRYNEANLRALKRCSRCILPETFPFIHFDGDGICNYCHGYKPKYRGADREATKHDFLLKIEAYRKKNGEPDVLVPFSGGRDSCFGLHLLKKEFGLNPITFTYDWGMVTDLARRNIARMCGALGVQNILVSADIKKKRENIRRNVAAWLKQPDLGLVPLFMAGDKHFFKIINAIKIQTEIKLNIWSSNELENTDFKSGFCGVKPNFKKTRFDYLTKYQKTKMICFYLKNFLKNPRYINLSLLDTIEAFASYYFERRADYLWLFNHITWDEKEVESTIINKYNFEIANDSVSTWRIGDGSAPFYNYIYVTSRGFSEFDTFRSNQIREGMLTRTEALSRVLKDNRPRWEGLKWYFEVIGLEFDSVIKQINKLDSTGLHQ